MNTANTSSSFSVISIDQLDGVAGGFFKELWHAAVDGGKKGAVAGTVIGAQSGQPIAGAIIGGVAGTEIGAAKYVIDRVVK